MHLAAGSHTAGVGIVAVIRQADIPAEAPAVDPVVEVIAVATPGVEIREAAAEATPGAVLAVEAQEPAVREATDGGK